jgi:pimeloyl-ACP methyl ester carboxylesterase
MSAKTLFATFVGIDAYPQQPLNGCIKDVLELNHFISNWCRQQDNRINFQPKYFLSPDEVDIVRLEKYRQQQKEDIEYEEASFSNVSSKAFSHFKSAADGDICLFYYSGHGSQTEAPVEFQHLKSDRNNETIVCVDSRSQSDPNARDLIDKEIAYLLWDALKDKKVHCLIIMDCCNSGGNTRSFNDKIHYRHIGASRNKIPLSSYIGYSGNSDFYTLQAGTATFPIADYVHLAAAMDFEKAQESEDGGLFTTKLVEILRNGGSLKTYRDLMQSVGIAVKNRNNNQTPVAYSFDDKNLDTRFLSGEGSSYGREFEIRFDLAAGMWKLYGGAMDGIVPSGRHAETTVKIAGTEKVVRVKQVLSDFSILEDHAMLGFDKSKEDYRGSLVTMANRLIKVGLSSGVRNDEVYLKALRRGYEAHRPLYFEILFDEDSSPADYLIQLTAENKFVLTGVNNAVPLFKREDNATSFLNNVDAVGKWISTSEIANITDFFNSRDFIIEVEIIEGQVINPASLDVVKGRKSIIQPGDELNFAYQGELQPAFRYSISIHPDSTLQECFIGALYLESKFGIRHDLVPAGSRLVKGGTPLQLKTIIKSINRESTTIPLRVDPKYALYNVNDINGFLKIFIADKPLNLEKFRQDNLHLDEAENKNFRGGDLDFDRTNDNIGKQAEWNVFSHTIKITGPNKRKNISAAAEADFAAFTVTAPEGISVDAVAVTGDDIRQKMTATALRSVDKDINNIFEMVTPPEEIWGDTLTDSSPFAKGLNPSAENGVLMLEILPEKDELIQIPEGETIDIKISVPNVNTRSIDDENFEETIIPYGFDEQSGFWFPLGYCDDEGVIHIQQLPAPTPGVISETGVPLSRSLGGSIKMFFKKIFRRKQRINNLVLYAFNEDGSWKELGREPKNMKPLLEQFNGGKALLLIHGLTGDTKHIVKSLEDLKELNGMVNCVLTYDYENMATPIKDAAKGLSDDLILAGFGQPGIPSLTIVAHSQGGLVSRWLVEKENGNAYVNKMILVGVASAGSEMAKLGSAILGLITHALNGPPVIKLVITGLSFVLKKMKLDPGRTLKDTKPGSDFIVSLQQNDMAPGVVYTVIGGDISLLKNYDGDDPFFKRLWKSIMRGVVFPGITATLFNGKKTDIAVTLESMEAIHGFDPSVNMKIVASNHLAYFREKLCQEELLQMLKL